MKVTELQGSVLDWAVAKCEGIELIGGRYNRLLVDGHMSQGQEMMAPYKPSTDWAQGGPIIDREGIQIQKHLSGWVALPEGAEFSEENYQEGETPLIAAMRCYVASKLGEEIEVPARLLEAA